MAPWRQMMPSTRFFATSSSVAPLTAKSSTYLVKWSVNDSFFGEDWLQLAIVEWASSFVLGANLTGLEESEVATSEIRVVAFLQGLDAEFGWESDLLNDEFLEATILWVPDVVQYAILHFHKFGVSGNLESFLFVIWELALGEVLDDWAES